MCIVGLAGCGKSILMQASLERSACSNSNASLLTMPTPSTMVRFTVRLLSADICTVVPFARVAHYSSSNGSSSTAHRWWCSRVCFMRWRGPCLT